MTWLSELGTLIIVTILSLSSQVTTLVDATPTTPPPPTNALAPVPGSLPNKNPIPRILLENAAFQQASLGASQALVAAATVNNPADALVNIFCTYRTHQSGFATPLVAAILLTRPALFLPMPTLLNFCS